ncbi:type II toxin-antitoxin system VapB family antitoxin [Pseudoxanthobacter sp. M-2]|uniref:type II toxin-antitoxin system VapB family antitoxin n=1 Tax=Pseudoxanthobacter sp. M-2 TaxID=3078754 RepID=UPI0038FCD972
MALTIRDPEAERLAREIAAMTGETVPQVVLTALRERAARLQARDEALLTEVLAIGEHCASLPVLDERSSDAILGYGANGLPG